MTNQEKQNIADTVNNEGFDYTFNYYSDFEEIKDEKFHELISNYQDATKDLQDYIELEKYLP